MSLSPGEVIDNKYRIVRMIGEGGMGAVYEGENVRIRRRVAIKVLRGAAAENGEVVARFEREAQAAGTIGNDHILEVLDLGALANGERFIVMEFLDGESLGKRIERLGRLTPKQLAPIIHQTLAALTAAHAAGIVHRDLKPDNIFILKQKAGRADFVKLIDFGISKFQPYAGGETHKMTRAGAIMGTPHYMSPEQANGSAEADQRADIYALGVVMYEAVTGQVPYDAKTFNELLFQIVLQEPPSPQQLVGDLDPHFNAIILKAMAKQRDYRFQSAAEMDQALEAWMQGQPLSFPPPPTNTAYNIAGRGMVQAPTPQGRAPMVPATNYAGMHGSNPTLEEQMARGGSVPNAQWSTGQMPAQMTPMPGGSSNALPYGTPVPVPQGTPLPQGTPMPGQPARPTQNSWNNSQPPAVAPAPRTTSKAPLVFIALGALVVLGGVGFAASRLIGGSSSKSSTTAPAKANDDKTTDDDSPKKKPSKGDDGDDDDSKGKATKAGDDDSNPTAGKPTSTAAPTPSTSANLAPTTPPPTPSNVPTVATVVKPKPPSTATKPTTKPDPKTKPTATTGGNPDFGY